MVPRLAARGAECQVNTTRMYRRSITDHYRHVQYTRQEGKASQLVSMKLEPGQEIGWEQHDVDQYLVIVQGKAYLDTDTKEDELEIKSGELACAGDAFVVPAGTRHNLVNASKTDPLTLWSVYVPPEHPANKIQPRKGGWEDAWRRRLASTT